METTFENQKEKSIDILLKTRELNTLLSINKHIDQQTSYLEYKGLNEFQYCENNAKLNTYLELKEFINEKIKMLK